jgi:hypothetical protein
MQKSTPDILFNLLSPNLYFTVSIVLTLLKGDFFISFFFPDGFTMLFLTHPQNFKFHY